MGSRLASSRLPLQALGVAFAAEGWDVPVSFVTPKRFSAIDLKIGFGVPASRNRRGVARCDMFDIARTFLDAGRREH
jgi:hypothetical protein